MERPPSSLSLVVQAAGTPWLAKVIASCRFSSRGRGAKGRNPSRVLSTGGGPFTRRRWKSVLRETLATSHCGTFGRSCFTLLRHRHSPFCNTDRILGTLLSQGGLLFFELVGATGIEPVTPTMST